MKWHQQSFSVSDVELIRHSYVDEGIGLTPLSNMFGCTLSKIRRSLVLSGATIRGHSGTRELLNIDYSNLRCSKCGVLVKRKKITHRKKLAHLRCAKCFGDIFRETSRAISERLAAIAVSPGAEQVILGSILGDGHLNAPTVPNGQWGLALKHCFAQEDYLRWKVSLLGELVSKPVKKSKDRVNARTVMHPHFSRLADQFIIDGRKSVSAEALANLSPLGFGVWYLDDGNYTPPRRAPHSSNGRIYERKHEVRFSTCSFTTDEINILRELLSSKVDVVSTICKWKNPRKLNEPYEGISLYGENASKFLNYVRPVLIGCGMNYKLGAV